MCFVHTGKKLSVIVVNLSSPENNLLFTDFQNLTKDDLRRLLEAWLMMTWAVHTLDIFFCCVQLFISSFRHHMTEKGWDRWQVTDTDDS